MFMCGRQHSQKWGKLPKGKHRIFQRTETQRCFLQKIAHNLKHFDDLSLRFGYPPPFYACTALLLSIPQETLYVHNLVCCKNNQNLRIKPEPLYSWSRCNCICPVFVYKLSTVQFTHCILVSDTTTRHITLKTALTETDSALMLRFIEFLGQCTHRDGIQDP